MIFNDTKVGLNWVCQPACLQMASQCDWVSLDRALNGSILRINALRESSN